MNLLQAQALCKTYGTGETAVQALKDVSFSVPKGEFVAVVGESGSGKSTLLNLLGGLDTPTSGKVLLDGRDLFAMKERERTIFRRRNIGFVFQAFNLIPELTVEQNILFPVLLDYQKPDTAYLEELLKEASRKYAQTIVMITHSRSIAQTADRVLQVSDGVLTDFGRCAE